MDRPHLSIRFLPFILAVGLASAGAADPVRIEVDCGISLGKNVPFWASMVFHPTEYLDSDWGRDLVKLLAESGAAARYIRLYNQPEDAVWIGEDGKLRYEWDHFDRRADLLLGHGIKPIVAFFSMPEPIAADPGKNRKRSFLDGKKIFIGPPKDYTLWQQMCADFTRHVIERFGEEEVLSWIFLCWNEPDLGGFWAGGNYREYPKLYDHFAAGVKGVNPKIRIGGPSYSSGRTFSNPESWKFFLDHITDGTNFVTGEKGSPIDLITIHTYGGHGGGGGSEAPQPDLDYLFTQQRKFAAIRDEYPGLRKVPILVSEWGATSGGATTMFRKPTAEVRNSQFGASFLASMAARHLAWKHSPEDPRISDLSFCISGYEKARETDFQGQRTVHTVNGFHKPILNAYKMLAMLGDNLVEGRVAGDAPNLEVIAAGDEARIAVLVSHHVSKYWKNDGPAAEVALRVATAWKEPVAATVTHWRIDEDHSNAYTIFRKLGRPERPTPDQTAQIRERMGLETLGQPEKATVGDTFQTNFELPCNGVSLIEIERD